MTRKTVYWCLLAALLLAVALIQFVPSPDVPASEPSRAEAPPGTGGSER